MTNKELKEKIEQLENDITFLNQQLEEAEAEARDNRHDYEDSQSEVEQLEKQLEDLEEKKDLRNFSEEIFDSKITKKPVYV